MDPFRRPLCEVDVQSFVSLTILCVEIGSRLWPVMKTSIYDTNKYKKIFHIARDCLGIVAKIGMSKITRISLYTKEKQKVKYKKERKLEREKSGPYKQVIW